MRAGVSSVPIEDARIDEIAATIAREFEPAEIILFGSYARGEQNTDSDIDLLVVFKHAVDKGGIGESIRPRSRNGLPARRNSVLEPAPNRAHASYVNFSALRTPGGAIGASLVVKRGV